MSRSDRGAQTRGFTIIELLIVVVVIAILAAISIVAYSGFQQRARISSLQAAISQVQKKIEIARVESDQYPSSITDCPSPASGAACVQMPGGFTASVYSAIPQGARSSPVGSGSTATPTYEVTISSSDSLIYKTSAERTHSTEYVQYMDMAPIIDSFGMRPYTLTFDIKSANIANRNTVTVYQQNGSTAKYTFSTTVPVTTSWSQQSVIVTPTLLNSTTPYSVLTFYGTYGTGNIPTIKNLEITSFR